jgi:regulator of protease activity HflC (stomatin/prohibitin superfamily)
MFFIIIGIFALVTSIFLPSIVEKKSTLGIKRYLKLASIGLIILGALTKCIQQVEAGYVGVQTMFGKVQNHVLTSGLNFINPLVDVHEIEVRTQNYTMSGIHDEGEKQGDDAIAILTRDGLEVKMDLSVLYQVNPMTTPKLFASIGSDFKEKIIRPITRTKIRDQAVAFDAVELFSTKREIFQENIFKEINKEFIKRGLILENILVRNITLPEGVKRTIESKISAEQEAQKMQFVLAKEKQEAERKRVEAQGIADYQKTISSTLTSEQLKYEQIKAYKDLAESENSKIIVMPSNGNVILNTN